jgi:hypothetical protein
MMTGARQVQRLRHLSILMLAALSLAPAAGRAADVPAAWMANDISVAQSLPGKEPSASTRFEVGGGGDARIEVNLRDGRTHTTGTIVLVGGRWMLTRGFTAPPGKEIAALDVATLNSQLVIVLLTAALPKGPPAPGSPQQVHFTEKGKPIRIATPSASAEYGPPWTVEGTVSVPAAGEPATFRLSFTFSAQGRLTTTVFAGNIGDSKSPVYFSDSMKLAGWTIRRVDSSQAQQPDGTNFGYGARPPVPKVATIGELRKLE